MKKHRVRMATFLFAAAATTAGLLGTAGVASAAPRTTYTTVSGVTLANMWMHCNAYGGDYSEGSGWALCVLPNGQTVVCTTASCVISNVATEGNGNRGVVPRSSIVGARAD